MDAQMSKEVTVKLSMSIEQAKWLKAVMQNELRENETREDSSNREDIFMALDRAGVGSN